MEFRISWRFFVPEGTWLKRTGLLLAFILLDHFVTLFFCSAPFSEGNIYARWFMEVYGIALGLTLFNFLINLPIYLILCIDSHLIKLPEKVTKKADMVVDVLFAWFIAGAHFNGAASWFWSAPDLLRQTVGFSIYLAFAALWLTRPLRNLRSL